jgi:hypothetical protein
MIESIRRLRRKLYLLYLLNQWERAEEAVRDCYEMSWVGVQECRRSQRVISRLITAGDNGHFRRSRQQDSAVGASPSGSPGVTSTAYAKIALTGFVQVLLVSLNTYNIAHGHAAAAVSISFLISITWTLNVRSVSIGGWTERILYSASAAFGTVVGMVLSTALYGAI